MEEPVYEKYIDFNFNITFIENGYLLQYKDPSYVSLRTASFRYWDELCRFLKEKYTGEWK